MALATQVAAVKAQMQVLPYGTIVDFIQLVGFFGTVSINKNNGVVTLAGTPMTDQQYFLVGQAMGIC